MSVPASLPVDRILKLIPRLASEHDGEVVATVRAIDRTLKGVGLDWHDLARAVTTPASAARPSYPFTFRRGPLSWHSMTPDERREALARLAAYRGLSAWEKNFVASVEARLRTNPFAPLTAKQVRVLDTLLSEAAWEAM